MNGIATVLCSLMLFCMFQLIGDATMRADGLHAWCQSARRVLMSACVSHAFDSPLQLSKHCQVKSIPCVGARMQCWLGACVALDAMIAKHDMRRVCPGDIHHPRALM